MANRISGISSAKKFRIAARPCTGSRPADISTAGENARRGRPPGRDAQRSSFVADKAGVCRTKPHKSSHHTLATSGAKLLQREESKALSREHRKFSAVF
jgi:hypothetical protein